MEASNKTVAFIPVRGGSKSIPLKNIKLINERPLVYWVLDAADKCKEIDVIYVATDNHIIREVVEKYNSPKIQVIDRSYESSTDIASTELAMLEFAEKYKFKDIVLIQATSPLLKSEDLINGFNVYRDKKVDSVLSVVRQKRFIWEECGEFIKPINYNPQTRPRRQEYDGFIVENGAFYITSRDNLIKSKCRISGNIKFTEMSEESYFEPDEPMDWLIVESLLKNREKY